MANYRIQHLAFWRFLKLVSVFAAVGFSGCSESGLDLAEVTGVVTLDGQPLASAGVAFQPSLGPLATGTTDSEGRFRLYTANKEGALVGEHSVTIAQNKAPEFAGDELGLMGVPMRKKRSRKAVLPKKYGHPSKTDLHAEVSRDGKNVFEFELSSKEEKQ